jgi:predicted nucleotide-binding protein
MKHTGSFDDLQAIVRAVGFIIDESDDKGNCKQIRIRDGAIVNWFESTGTLQFQGKKIAKEKLENAIATYTGTPAAIAVAPDGKTSGIPVPAPIDSAHSKKVFVVHGHDATAREQLELILHRLGLNPFVLQNTAGEGPPSISAKSMAILLPGIRTSDVAYDFAYVDEESFEKYKPTSFRQLLEAFKEYKGEI